jgi:hypothetical protein
MRQDRRAGPPCTRGGGVLGRSSIRTKFLAVAGLAAVLLTACGGDQGSSSAAGSSGSAAAKTSAQTSGKASGKDNGLAGKSGPEVATAAADALDAAGSVHVKGDLTEGGTQGSIDVQLQGDDSAGTISMQGQAVQLISTGGKVYAQAPAGFWTANGVPAEAVGQLDGKWVVLPDSVGGELDTLSLKALTEELRNPGDSTIEDAVTKGEVDGTPVVVVTQDNGSTLSVAATGDAYPLQIADKGAAPSTLTLSDFGTKQTIAAPPSPLDLGLGG